MGFHEDDVKSAMRDVRSKTPSANSLHRTPHLVPRAILCLHAGNLPLVGWHDVVSVHRAGMAYVGKLSRKDPHLGEWIREWMPEARISTELDDFTDLRADAVLFSGSEDSVPAVLARLKEIGAVHEQTRYLIRTAHTSLAWVDSLDADTMKDLAEGIARYDGQGCRSVRYIYSPFSFEQAQGALSVAAGAFADRPLFPRNVYRKAYLNSIGKASVNVGRLLVSDVDPLWDDDDAVVWVHADIHEMLAHAQRLGTGLQQLYFTTERMQGGRWEPLSQAQKPGIDWQPDGVDVVSWLKEI